jgi:DNA-binding transcriptional LysR family regulator
VELRHLRYFVAVAEELHFRRAAERLYVAQPAVSEQVRKLEEELGVRLFDRTQRSVSLTVAGTALLEEARHILRHAEVAREAARNAGDRATMRLRIGYLPDSLPASVPCALRQLASSAPTVQVDLETGPALRLIEELRAHRLDVAVVALPAPTNGLRTTLLEEQRAVAVLPVSHPSAGEPSIPLERLAPERLVVLPREVNPPFHDSVVALCHRAGLSPTFFTVREPRVEHVLLAVAAGAGMAVVPESVTERSTMAGLRFVPLEAAEPAIRTAALTRPDTESLATVAFVRALSQAARPRVADRLVSAVPAQRAA